LKGKILGLSGVYRGVPKRKEGGFTAKTEKGKRTGMKNISPTQKQKKKQRGREREDGYSGTAKLDWSRNHPPEREREKTMTPNKKKRK